MSFKLLFVVLVGLHVQTQTWGRPYASQDPDDTDQSYTYEQVDPSQAFNETERIDRGKRQVTVLTLANVCPGGTSPGSSNPPPFSHPCVKGWQFCPRYNLFDAECNSSAFSCLSSIPRHGFPKCRPIFKTVIINPGTNDEKHVILKKTCTCA